MSVAQDAFPENGANKRVADILYIGPASGTSLHRANALARLGHNVRIIEPNKGLPHNRLVSYWIHHTGARGLSPLVTRYVQRAIQGSHFDVIWVCCGELLSPALMQDLKRHGAFLVNYNNDDPFGGRDGDKWRLYWQSLPFYDLTVVVRDCNIAEAKRAGAKEVMRVFMSSDEIAHAARPISERDREKWKSEVAFIGTWMPERGFFMARLVELGVPLSIWGDRWQRAPEWPILQPHWRGPGIYNDDDYAKAVQCAKVCIGMLSKGNRDLSTTRSFEIPHLGSLLCAERTAEHEALYQDGVEAVFWNDTEECAQKCQSLLANDEWRENVAANGQRRHFRNAVMNGPVMQQILDRLLSGRQPAATPGIVEAAV